MPIPYRRKLIGQKLDSLIDDVSIRQTTMNQLGPLRGWFGI